MTLAERAWTPGPGLTLACWSREGSPHGLWGPAPGRHTLRVAGRDPDRGWWRARTGPGVLWLGEGADAWGRWQVTTGARRPWNGPPETLEALTDAWLTRESHQLLTLCRRLFEWTLSHARCRQQFSRPIGTFWAIQEHLLTWETGIVSWGALLDEAPPGVLAWRRSRQEALQASRACAAIAAGTAHDRAPPFGPVLHDVRRRLTRWPLPVQE
ncbi:MAG: hypothetical protein VKP72_04900 [bacterium]|nr:hypothetical protein [bacterium]